MSFHGPICTNVCAFRCAYERVCIAARLEEPRDVVVTCLVFRSAEKQRRSLLDPDSITNQPRTRTHSHARAHTHTYTCSRQPVGYDVTSITIITRHKSCGVTPCQRLNGCPMCQPGMAALYCRVPPCHHATECVLCCDVRVFFLKIHHSLLNDTKCSFIISLLELRNSVDLTTVKGIFFSRWQFVLFMTCTARFSSETNVGHLDLNRSDETFQTRSLLFISRNSSIRVTVA